jgi:hypothetical protein
MAYGRLEADGTLGLLWPDAPGIWATRMLASAMVPYRRVGD